MKTSAPLPKDNPHRSARHEQGLTLLEMMIALCIGSWVILAATGLYLSVSRAALFEQDLNTDQQDLQYLQQFLADRLLQADAISPASTSTTLALEYRATAGLQSMGIDCAGQVHDEGADRVETIVFDDAGRITCHGAVLLDGVARFSLRYGVDRDRNHYLQEREYLSADNIDAGEWPQVRAIRVEFGVFSHDGQRMRHDHLLYFALHQKIMAGVNHVHD